MLVKAAPEDEYVDKYVSQVFVKSSWEACYIFVSFTPKTVEPVRSEPLNTTNFGYKVDDSIRSI